MHSDSTARIYELLFFLNQLIEPNFPKEPVCQNKSDFASLFSWKAKCNFLNSQRGEGEGVGEKKN